MAYTTYRGKRVSPAHKTLLSAYEKRYGPVQLNQGARTIAEQTTFWLNYLRNGWPVAARPWGGAPHIKWGAQHHALDINAGNLIGQAQHVASFYRVRGVPVAFNVNREPWHMDTLDQDKLLAAARAIGGHEHRTIKFGSRGPLVLHAKRLLRNWGVKGIAYSNPLFGTGTRAGVKRFQKNRGLRADGVIGPRTWAALERKR